MKKILNILFCLLMIAPNSFAFAVGDEAINSKNNFPNDIAGHKYEESINYLYSQKIVDGYSDGSFKPDITINRAELLKIIIESKYDNEFENYSNQNCFSDVKADNWYTKYICFAKNKKIIQGYSDGTFKPDQYINMVESLKVTMETFDVEISKNEKKQWYDPYIEFAKKTKIKFINEKAYEDFLTRAEMAELIYILQTEQNSNWISLSSLSHECDGECVFIAIVDEKLQKNIEENLNIWKNDVESDFNTKVEILLINADLSPEGLRTIMWEHENEEKKDVSSFLLIGQLPYFLAYNSEEIDDNIYNTATHASELPFYDEKGKCPYLKELNAYNTTALAGGCDYLRNKFIRPFVISRLNPDGGKESQSLLINNYLIRNHQHRTSNALYGSGNGKLLRYFSSNDKSEQYYQNIISKAENFWDFNNNNIKTITPFMDSTDEMYFKELENNYSFVHYLGHGSPTHQDQNISAETLKNKYFNSLFYSFSSCSVGDFSKENSLAKEYFFTGNSLFVEAFPVDFATGSGIPNSIIYVRKGMPLYQYYSEDINVGILFGDPTLIFRKNNNKLPDVKINASILDFGKIAVSSLPFSKMENEEIGEKYSENGEYYKGVAISIRNNSGKPIYIDYVSQSGRFFQNQGYEIYGQAPTIYSRFGLNGITSLENEPFGQSYGIKINAKEAFEDAVIAFTFEKTDLLKSENPYKKYAGMLTIPIYSEETDTINYLELPFKGEIKE